MRALLTMIGLFWTAGFAVAAPPGQLLQLVSGANELQAIPTAGVSADHATVACNDRGDVFAAWNSFVRNPVTGENTRQVEGAFMQRVDTESWALIGPFLLGDPFARQGWTSGRCHKPDVCASGNDFVVAWPRIDDATKEAQLEVAWIEVDAAGELREISESAVGVGWPVGPARFPAGKAGVMPDLVDLDGGHIGVLYAAQTSGQKSFELWWSAFDRSGLETGGGSIPQTLRTGLELSGTTAGGRILPDVVADGAEDLFVAYEDRAPGTGQDGPIQIWVDHFRLQRANWTLAELSRWDASAVWPVVPSVHHRRPMLDCDPQDGRLEVALAVGVLDQRVASAGFAARYGVLDFGGAAPVYTDGPFPDVASPHYDPSRPVPLHRVGTHAVFSDLRARADVEDVPDAIFSARMPNHERMVHTGPEVSLERPAVAIGAGGDVLTLVCEGRRVGAVKRQIYFQFQML